MTFIFISDGKNTLGFSRARYTVIKVSAWRETLKEKKLLVVCSVDKEVSVRIRKMILN